MANNNKEFQHAYLEAKGKFTIACDNIFTSEEKELLEKYGHLFEALSDGTILPIDTEQEQFVEAAR